MRVNIFGVLLAWVELHSFVRGFDRINSTGIENQDSGRRVLFGDLADPKDFPFLLLLENDGLHCSGSIINDYWIMSAAHCLFRRICTHTILHPALNLQESIRPFGCFIHPEFVFERYRYDISLLKVGENIVRDGGPRPIPLPDPSQYFASGRSATVVGWGKTEDGTFPNQLLTATVKVEDWDQCNREWKSINTVACGQDWHCENIPVRVLCTTGTRNPTGTCLGDSGGPVIIKGIVAGIVSFVLQDPPTDSCIIGSPSIHVSVTDYLPWIYSHVAPEVDASNIQVRAEI